MINETIVKSTIVSLLNNCQELKHQDEPEKRTEDFIRTLFQDALGWKWLSNEVVPQKRIRGALSTTRVDYQFKKTGELRPSFYMEVKRFSNKLIDIADIKQALEYGKNSGTRWIVLTNFIKWRVFNSDYFDEPEHAEIFEFEISNCLTNSEHMQWLLLFSHECGGIILDEYAKQHKKWKESADIEEMLTEQLLEARRKLSIAIKDTNIMKFDTGQNMEESIDSCVQTILDRIIFCRMLEDSGGDPERRLRNVLEIWENEDARSQFYKDFLCPFFIRMHDKYDSTIFDHDRVDRLSIKNEDFMPVLKSFYVNPKTKLGYRFDVISTDVLGHAYENYLSWKATSSRKGIEKELYKRKQGGIYYTPEFLVDFLVSSTLGELLKKCKTPADVLKIRVLDPACGSGTFLVRAFKEFSLWLHHYEQKRTKKDESTTQTHLDVNSETYLSSFHDKVLENCLYGIDLDPRAVRLARLNLFLRAVNTPKQLPRLNIIEKNSLVWDSDDPKAFNIEKDFPLVVEAGGFDVVLGNPPWEKWKPNSQEFFEAFDPGFKSLPTQTAKKRIDELLRKPYIKKCWIGKQAEYELYSTIFRENYKWQSAEVNGRMVSGDLDLYKIFIERAYQLLRDGGMTGFVIPSGIYTDLGAKGLRTMLFERAQIRALYSFENKRHAIFPAVHASYKPILLVFQKGGKTKSFPCAFFLHSVGDLHKATKNPTIMDVEFIKKSSPTSWSILEINTHRDKEIVEKLLKHPSLGENIENTWNVYMQSGFHMTNDSHLFKTGKLGGIPMLEGKNIEQFTHQWKEAPRSRYTITQKDVMANLAPEKIYHTDYWMAYRLIASSTNYRTFISTIVPPRYVCGNSIAIIKLPTHKQLCYLCGIMNSFVIDYLIRQKVSANVNMFYFLETPVPRLSSGKEFDLIVRRVAQLVSTSKEFSELKKEIGIEHELINENDRALARAQLDATVAKIYGITKNDLSFILEHFPNIDNKQKELVLEQY
ncbi:MAG: N-6 DNA methylase [Candidatus Aenigmarchaeota archaeon]|nr:N-6 DNA methylase [Candidatus Aenigmarchaeota archaeon]